jgi:hypothetical protein
MIDQTNVEPGSPLSLTLFHAWCRVAVAWALHQGRPPALLFADGPAREQPSIAEWEIELPLPESGSFLTELIERWMDDAEASQIAISIPFHGDGDGVLLLCVDETGHVAEVAMTDTDGYPDEWQPLARGGLPFGDWQRRLAKHAGYRDLSKWRCGGCESICIGESDEIPSPCEFCGSEQIESVPIETPLAPPQPPYLPDREPDELDLFTSPFGLTLLELITRGPWTRQLLPRTGG